MAIIKPTQTMMMLFGYLESFSQARWYVIYRYTTCVFTWNLVYPMTMYGIKHIADLAIVFETISLAAGEWNSMGKSYVLVTKLHVFTPMLNALQRNVDKKIANGRGRHYVAMDRQATLLSRIAFGWMFSSICSIALGPLLLIIYRLASVGHLEPEDLRLPVQMALPYDLTSWPGYHLTYLGCIITIMCTGNSMVLMDCVFLGLCSHIIACQRDLQDMLRELDGPADAVVNRHAQREGEHMDKEQSRAVERRLTECVQFHYEILTYVSDLADAASGAVLTQFVLSVVQIGTLAFQIQLGENVAIDRVIANGITSIVALMELLIYCYYGNLVTHEGQQVAEAAYESPWYRYPSKIRRRIWLIMMRSQQPKFFLGGKIMMCTLKSYTSVLNMIGSALALMRSVV